MKPSPLSLSSADQQRIGEIHRLAQGGAASVDELISRLTEPSWAVRRAVVAALGALGEPAVRPLCDVLRFRRDNEARLAAAVDALVASRARVEEEVVSLSRNPDPQVAAEAAQILGRRRAPESVPVLSALVEHADDNVAVAAIESLGRIGGAEALDSLLAVVDSGNFFRTFPAIGVLARSGDRRAIEPLARLLDNPLYAQEAARALGRLGFVESVSSLSRLLTRPHDSAVRAGALALFEVRSAFLARYGTSSAVERTLREAVSRPGAIRRVAQAVADAPPHEQQALCQVVGWLKGEPARAALLALLDAAPAAAAEALKLLGHEVEEDVLLALREGDSARRLLLLPLIVGQKSAVEECILCLDDPDPAVRTAACDAITRLMDPAAVPALFAHLADPNPRVAQSVVAAIQSLGSAETERLSMEAARSPEPRVRRAALRIISYFGFTSALPLLEGAVRGPDEGLREVALQGLPYIDDPRALQALLEAACSTSERTRAGVMRALGQTSAEPQVLQVLRGGLEDPDPWVRYFAAQSLGRLDDAASAPALVALMQDPAGQVRAGVVDALSRLHTPEAFAALKQAATAEDPDLQRAALLGLGISKNPEALPILVQEAESEDAATRLIALSAAAEFDTPVVLPVLARAARDSDESVRNAAIGHLAAWQGPGATQVLVGLLSSTPIRERVVAALATPADGRIAGLLAALDSADEDTASHILSALARMGRADATSAILSAIDLPSPAARRAAAETLAALDTPEARAALSRAAKDPDPEIRRLAGSAER